jgi:alkylation response protein AidB-like acyl-CoA dehydrogenase
MDVSDPKAPKIVHGFLPRTTPGITIKVSWDVLGMRATRSDDTQLEGAFCPDKYIARVVPAGAAGIDNIVLGIFAWGLRNIGNIYYGLGRVRDLIVEHVRPVVARTDEVDGVSPGVQHGVAEIALS